MIGSDRYVTVSGKPVLGRKTKWGLIEGEKNFQTYVYMYMYLIVVNVSVGTGPFRFLIDFSA